MGGKCTIRQCGRWITVIRPRTLSGSVCEVHTEACSLSWLAACMSEKSNGTHASLHQTVCLYTPELLTVNPPSPQSPKPVSCATAASLEARSSLAIVSSPVTRWSLFWPRQPVLLAPFSPHLSSSRVSPHLSCACWGAPFYVPAGASWMESGLQWLYNLAAAHAYALHDGVDAVMFFHADWLPRHIRNYSD